MDKNDRCIIMRALIQNIFSRGGGAALDQG